MEGDGGTGFNTGIVGGKNSPLSLMFAPKTCAPGTGELPDFLDKLRGFCASSSSLGHVPLQLKTELRILLLSNIGDQDSSVECVDRCARVLEGA